MPDRMQSNSLTALSHETRALLESNNIYSVLAYAWEGEDTPSDEYIGLAMWSSDAPFELCWNPWDRTSPPQNPSRRDEAFYKAGEDFLGIMELARNALGVALYSYEHREKDNLLNDDESFWEHTAIAAVWLNIAADRIRDYLLAARFHTTAKLYKKSGPRRNGYLHPFSEDDPAETPEAKITWEELKVDAKKLEKKRATRNLIVHEVASQQGRRAVEAVKRQREESRQNPYQPRISSDAVAKAKTWKEISTRIQDERHTRLAKEMDELKDWYLLLIHASSRVFEYEYWRRIELQRCSRDKLGREDATALSEGTK